ncbi:MAG: hypothetical protein U5N86_09835 [Planctomycetota bacterium]|nr:hypothetical protein [Planctomycetota bacterium]
MEALIVGFTAEDEPRLEKSLPNLSAYDTVFTKEAEHPLDKGVSLVVYSVQEFDLAAVCYQLSRRPELIVYVECGYGDFLRLDPANRGTTAEIARAIETAALARDLLFGKTFCAKPHPDYLRMLPCSTGSVKHWRRDGDHCQPRVDQRAASRIYTAVDDFNEFHTRIEQLLGVLASLTPSRTSSSGT